ncbi:MAG: sensor histidine kinase [Alphaproteobacteria bacterium]
MLSNLRIFSLISVSLIVVVAFMAGINLKQAVLDHTLTTIEQNNKSLAKFYTEMVWTQYRDVIVPLSTNNPSALGGNPQVIQFAQETIKHFRHMPLVRVNIYNAAGMLLMSVDTTGQGKLVSKNASPDKNFVVRELRSISAKNNVLDDVELQGNPKASLLQSLLPIRSGESGNLDGALEMIYDISDTQQHAKYMQIFSTLGIIVLFVVFLAIVIFSSRRAEAIIARQHEANIELAEAAATAEAQNREKSQFLANISHELRTPLNAVIGFSDIIKNEVIAPMANKKYHDYISDIHSSGVHLLSLINDILDYSKAEAGKLELEVSETNATKLVQNSMRLVSPRAESAKVKLTEALPKDAVIMLTDNKKLKQILLNLLSNAVKFTPAGGEVRVTAWRNAADDTYSFEVKDTGIGIAPKDISRAMAPFGQVDSSISRKYEGTGLGLPLTKKFVEIMGGKFTIESEVNVGTTIVFTLPRELKEREGVIIKYIT